jgi:hypothetical protein
MKQLFIAFAVLLPLTAGAADNRWSGFHSQETLRYWSTQTPPGIEENLRQVLLPKLDSAERRRIGEVTLKFPLEDGSHPMNFAADPGTATIYFPISSTRFFGDITLAYSWLQANGYSLDPVTDYLSMLKYQWPSSLRGKAYRPLEALGIPDNAREDARAYAIFQKAYASAVVFILGHELGHIHYRHAPYSAVTPAEAQRQETECDEFSLELMRRIGAAPIGITIYFSSLAHLQLVPGDRDYEAQKSRRTHPLSGARLSKVAAGIRRHADDMARTDPDIPKARATLLRVATEIETIGRLVDDPGVLGLLRQKGQTIGLDDLKPRRPGATLPVNSRAATGSAIAFDGVYSGAWLDAKGTDLTGRMTLTRAGNRVQGKFTFGIGNMEISDGDVEGDVLNFKWRWGTDYFGRGTLKANGDSLSGTWGYTAKSDGGGTWRFSREKAP